MFHQAAQRLHDRHGLCGIGWFGPAAPIPAAGGTVDFLYTRRLPTRRSFV